MISKMEHIAIIAKDMEKSIAFYSEMFGFKVRLQGSNGTREMAFLYLESQPDMEIELIRDIEQVNEYSGTGIVNHLAFTVENINASIKHYQAKGIHFTSSEPKPTLEGGKMILFYGPSGEFLQFVERL